MRSRTGFQWLVILGLGVLLAPSVDAQSVPGPFEPFNTHWMHPTAAGNSGIMSDATNIDLDLDGDGVVETRYARSLIDPVITELQLTPSREYLYGWGGSCGVDGSQIYFYQVAPPPNPSLDATVAGHCVNRVFGSPLARFYDSGLCLPRNPAGPNPTGLWCKETSDPDSDSRLGSSQQRVAYIIADSATPGETEITWIRFQTGTITTTGNSNFRSNVEFLHVAPSGNQAFVHHDLGTSVPATSDYTLIDLCPNINFGQAINAGGFPLLDRTESLSAAVTAVSATNLTIEIRDVDKPPADPPVTSFDLIDCLAFSAPIGACCHVDDSCTAGIPEDICFDGIWEQGSICNDCLTLPPTEACCVPGGSGTCTDGFPENCMGTNQGSGSVCSTTTCPAIDLGVMVTGPTNAQEGDIVTYTIGYSNSGDLAAPDTVFLTGIGVGSGGDVWVGWLPTYHYNPHTLEIQGFDWRRLTDTGMTNLLDIAVDPVTGTVYFLGNGNDEFGSAFATIRRYVPATDTLSFLADDVDHATFDRGAVDDTGAIVAVATGPSYAIVRIDPVTGALEDLGNGDMDRPGDVDVDADGDYVVISGDFVSPYAVTEIDADSGLTSSIDSDHATTFPGGSSFGWSSVAVDPDTDDVYVAPSLPGLGAIRRGAGSGADEVITFDPMGSVGQAEDMHFTAIPEPGPAALGAVALISLAALARVRRRRLAGP